MIKNMVTFVFRQFYIRISKSMHLEMFCEGKVYTESMVIAVVLNDLSDEVGR